MESKHWIEKRVGGQRGMIFFTFFFFLSSFDRVAL